MKIWSDLGQPQKNVPVIQKT